MSILKRIYTLIGAILIGLLASIWIIQSNTQLEVVLTKKLISKLENMWGIKIDVKSSRINFFTFSIFVKDGRIVDPKKDNCNWRFKQCKIHVSPLKLILNKKINLYLSFDDVAATTRFSNNNLDIVDHIAAMFAGGLDGLKIAPKVIQINNLDAEIVRDLHKIHILAAGRFRAEKISKHSKKPYSWHANFSVGDAQISLDDNVVAQDILLKGDLWRDKNTKNWNAKFGGQIKNFAPMPKKICNLEGEWNENKRQILIRSLDRSLNISVSDVVNILQIRGDFKLPDFVNTFNYLTKLPKEFTFSSGIAGNCNINAEYCLDSLMLQQGSNLAISNASYKGVGCDKIECKFLKNSSNKITSKISTTIRKGLDFEGICSWDWESGLGTSKFINTSTVKLFKNAIVKIGFSDYVVNPKNFMITAKINKELALDGLYKFNLVDQKTDEVRRFAGIYTFKNQELDISGSAGPGEYILKAQTSPSIHLSKVKYDNKKNVLIDFETQNKEDFVLKGDLEYSFIKSFFNPTIKNLFLGRDCVFGIEIDQHDLNKIQGLVKLVKGRFYIPESQNLVQEAQTGFEFVPPNKLCLTDAKIGCFKGEVFSPRITLVLDKFSGISFLHMPLQINDLLVNYKHDLLSVIYGNILIKKNVELDYKAFGQIVLKKTLLKENVFAAADKNNFYSQWSNFLPSCKDFVFDY